MPAIGAPLTYVARSAFLSRFGLGSLRDLLDIEALQEAGLLDRETREIRSDELDDVLGLRGNEDVPLLVSDVLADGT